ncbi:MAG: dTDP-4-dehydrorhamnose reductase [Saprospiraceae bacterium]|nr:dTDP-4-dehydrorhamnose reductase [Saprospiraceae bacterium]
MSRIVVTGCQGQLGREFQRIAAQSESHSFQLFSRGQMDITQRDLTARLREAKPNIVINCAAYTAVDQAEVEKELAFATNAYGAQNMARACAKLNVPLVHFSSDYVYHNKFRRPLRESDPTRPKGVYARSKLKGEQLIVEAHPLHLIVRVSWLYSVFGSNFPKTILHLARNRPNIKVVSDQVGAPTSAADLANTIVRITSRNSITDWKKKSGIYNYSNLGHTNWYAIARHIVKVAGLPCSVQSIKSRDYPTKAPRPRYSMLNLSKFRATFGVDLKEWKESLDLCLSELLNET